jgi:lipoprotein-anchoring transpeptidase ErfK/SrfK
MLVTAATLAGAPPVQSAEVVAFATDMPPGSIVIDTSERRLYLVQARGKARRYVVGVGRADRQWQGASAIEAKYRAPNWVPPAAIRADKPELPGFIPGGLRANPMGAAAMTLRGGPYAIHGTNVPGSVGGFVSYGCIRMLNADIMDLYGRVEVGTNVSVRP